MAYATETTVSAEKTRGEIEKVLTKYGADAFGYTVDGPAATIAFRMRGRHLKFALRLPEPSERQFTHHPNGPRSESAATNAYNQAVRSRWRALLLIIRAKLEAVEAGVSVFEDEFLANVMLPDGLTVADWIRPQVDQAYLTGAMPRHLQLTGPVQ